MQYIDRQLKPGITLEAIISGPIMAGASIVIPLSVVESSTDAEIAHLVRGMIPDAQYIEALNIAETLAADKLTSWLLDELTDVISKLEQHAGKHRLIDGVLSKLEYALTRKLNRMAAHEKRHEIRHNYDHIFTAIGRRDGFFCALCKTVDSLQIDHVVAVINGGGNDLENLQLLCATCNRKKGETR